MNLVEFKNFSLSDENNSLILKNINRPIKENEFIKKEAIQTNLNPFIMKVHHIFGGK